MAVVHWYQRILEYPPAPPSLKNIPKRLRKLDRLGISGQHCRSIFPPSTSSPCCQRWQPIATRLSSIYNALLVWQPCFKDAFTNHRASLRVKITIFSSIFEGDVAKSRERRQNLARISRSDARYVPLHIHIYSDTCFRCGKRAPDKQAQPTSEACHVCARRVTSRSVSSSFIVEDL